MWSSILTLTIHAAEQGNCCDTLLKVGRVGIIQKSYNWDGFQRLINCCLGHVESGEYAAIERNGDGEFYGSRGSQINKPGYDLYN